MAKNVNKVILVGNVGQDPEVKCTASGVPVAKVSLATNERFTPIPAVGCPSRRLLVRVLSPQEQGLRKPADWQGDPPTQ